MGPRFAHARARRQPLAGLSGFGHGLQNLTFVELPFDPDSDTTTLGDWLLKGPSEWTSEREAHTFTRPWVESARYLLVHRLEAVTPPTLLTEGSATTGTAKLLVSVVDAKTLQPLCHGAVTFSPEIELTGHGRGSTQEDAKTRAELAARGGLVAAFAQGLEVGALLELCGFGGEALCPALKKRVTEVDQFF